MPKFTLKNKLTNLHDLTREISDKKGLEHVKIVFTTGVFDVPSHKGHPDYLLKARNYGDFLIVGIHSDELTQKRKGKKPNSPEIERAGFISYWPFVDRVLILKDQENVYSTIRNLRPDFLVVSSTTEDLDNCPATMRSYFDSITQVEELSPQSNFHSSDFFLKKEKFPVKI